MASGPMYRSALILLALTVSLGLGCHYGPFDPTPVADTAGGTLDVGGGSSGSDASAPAADVEVTLCLTSEDCEIAFPDIGTCRWASCNTVTHTCVVTTYPNGRVCDDGDYCTNLDACDGGVCVGEDQCECRDDADCTDDADLCNGTPFCDTGVFPHVCSVEPDSEVTCPEDPELAPCQSLQCVPETGVCAALPAGEGESCEDDDPCSETSECVAGECVGTAEKSCDDGNACTFDICNPFTEIGECEHLPPDCSDADLCTSDSCDPATGLCLNDAKTCDDGNECTADSCDTETGACVFEPQALPCSDGIECTTGDHCDAGRCVFDTNSCSCTPAFGAELLLVSLLSVETTGHEGDGLDVDGDATTCAPVSACSDGVDNALGPLASLGIPHAQAAIDEYDALIFLEGRSIQLDGDPFVLAALQGSLGPCGDLTCPYELLASAFRADCSPELAFADATLEHGTVDVPNGLTAGGATGLLYIDLPIGALGSLTLRLQAARVDATAVVEEFVVEGFTLHRLSSLTGTIAGGVAVDDLIASIDAAPDERLPLSKTLLTSFVLAELQPDLDLDGDGIDESLSVGVHFETTTATVSGVAAGK